MSELRRILQIQCAGSYGCRSKKIFLQIFFCSRTHSQLSQFVGELRRTKYKDSMSLAALASRQASPDLILFVIDQFRGKPLHVGFA